MEFVSKIRIIRRKRSSNARFSLGVKPGDIIELRIKLYSGMSMFDNLVITMHRDGERLGQMTHTDIQRFDNIFDYEDYKEE